MRQGNGADLFVSRSVIRMPIGSARFPPFPLHGQSAPFARVAHGPPLHHSAGGSSPCCADVITTCDSCNNPKCSRARLLFGRISRAHHSGRGHRQKYRRELVPFSPRRVTAVSMHSHYTSWTGSEKPHAHVNEHKAKDEALDKGRLRTEASRLAWCAFATAQTHELDRIETRPLT